MFEFSEFWSNISESLMGFKYERLLCSVYYFNFNDKGNSISSMLGEILTLELSLTRGWRRALSCDLEF